MDALILLLNNGHNPFMGQGGLGYNPKLKMYGHGGLGYKPPIIGGQLELVSYEGDSPSILTNWEGKESNYKLVPSVPISFLVSAYNNPNATEDDKQVILKTYLDKKESDDKFNSKQQKFISTIIDKKEKQKIEKQLSEWNKKNSIEIGKKISQLGKKKQPEPESEEEEEEIEADDPEELEALLLGTEEKIGSTSSIIVLENQVRNLKEQQNKQYNKIRLFEKSKPQEAINLRKEVNLLQKDIIAREQAIEIIKNPQQFLQYKVSVSFTPEELQLLNNLEFDKKDFDKSDKNLIKYFNDNNYLVEDLKNNPSLNQLVYIPAYMKKTVLKATGEEAGKSLESNISVPIKDIKSPSDIQKKIGFEITKERGSLIISNDELLKSKKYKGFKQFCYDNVDNINHFFIECKKYDGKESFKDLYDEYVEQYNNFYLKFREQIDMDKKLLDEFEIYFDNYKTISKESKYVEILNNYDIKSKSELKEYISTLKKSINETLNSVKTNGDFDENKFKLKFYKECSYSGITIGINKFPKPSNWKGVDSANDEECFNEIKKNRGTHYDVQVDKTGNNFGYINNIVYESFGTGTKASKAEADNKNKIIQECYDFKNSYYGLIFNIACDDSMITFDYTNFMRDKVGKYEDITNIFRGNFSFYSMGGNTSTKYDSVVIPIDCFVPVNLKKVYGNL